MTPSKSSFYIFMSEEGRYYVWTKTHSCAGIEQDSDFWPDRVLGFSVVCVSGSMVRSYLSWLKDTGRAVLTFQGDMLLWQST